MIDISVYGSLPELVFQLTAVVLIAALIGFCFARWLYRSNRSVHTEILEQEILRLRRRVTDNDRQAYALRRQNDRMRRNSKRINELEGLGI